MSSLYALLFLYFAIYFSVSAKLTNVTVDDTDPSIIYLPSEAWRSSADKCPSCVDPNIAIAYQQSFHVGTHLMASDNDDIPSTIATSASTQPTAAAAAATTTDNDDNDPDAGPNDPDNHEESNGDENGKGKGGSGDSKRFVFSPRLDFDDDGFTDMNVTVQFNFTGSAVYIFCVQPQSSIPTATMPTAMNLSFTLDNKPHGRYMHAGSPNLTNFVAGVQVFSVDGLPDGPHTLLVEVGQNSIFFFDYMKYTDTEEDAVQATSVISTSPTSAAPASPSASIDPNVRKHNVGTFAGAIGGSVGVLAIFALGLAISIIRRRRAAARRDRKDRESLTSSDNSPPMSGPAPFVPRFFPGTIIPRDPPTYIDSLASSSLSGHHLSPASPLLSSLAASTSYSSPDFPPPPLPSVSLATSPLSPPPGITYADIPPSMPPPPLLDDGIYVTPPPPFPVAVSIPAITPIQNPDSEPSPTPGSSTTPTSTNGDREGERGQDDRLEEGTSSPPSMSRSISTGALPPPQRPVVDDIGAGFGNSGRSSSGDVPVEEEGGESEEGDSHTNEPVGRDLGAITSGPNLESDVEDSDPAIPLLNSELVHPSVDTGAVENNDGQSQDRIVSRVSSSHSLRR